MRGWVLFGLWAVLAAVASVLHALSGDTTNAVLTPALAAFAGMGALLVTRRPENRIGWILFALALALTVSLLTEGIYADDAERDAHPSEVVRLLVWLDGWLFYIWLGLATIVLPLLFPHGRTTSRGSRVCLRVGIGVIALAAVDTAFGNARLDWGENGSVANPLAVGGPAGDALEGAAAAAGPLFVLVALGALGGVAVRLHRSTGVERQQYKLFSLAVGVLLIGAVGAAVGEDLSSVAIGNAGWTLFVIGLNLGLPLAIGLAVLRHRLYDIDVVIRRTLVYGALTATLAGTYLGLVLLSGLAVGDSDLAVAAATLAVAALFRPALARIQRLVDRRFYRRRYDAAQTLEGFGARLRQELDLEALGADLRGVARETLQPAHVSLWLRAPEATR